MTPEEEQALIEAYRQMLNSGGAPGLAMGLRPDAGSDPNTNTYQDRMQILGDPLSSAMGGLGAYDASAFDPTYERNYVEAPGLSALRRWQTSSPSSVRGMMLSLILGQDQLTPEEAYADVLKTVRDNPLGDTARSIPPVMDQNGELSQSPEAGLFSVYKEYGDIQAAMDSDPTGSQYEDETGRFYTEEMIPSKLATKFRDEYMLPLPTESYLDPYQVVDGQEALGSVLEGEAMARQMLELGRGEPRREASPYPQFGDTEILNQQAIGRLRTSDQKGGDRWAGTDSFGLSPVEQERLDVRERDAREVVPETMRTDVGSLRDPEIDAWERSTGMKIDYDPIRRQTLDAYAGRRGEKREYDPIIPRVKQERRDLQAQINQGVRDRFKESYSSDEGRRKAIVDLMRARGADSVGRTPMYDAMRTRLAQQQLAGF